MAHPALAELTIAGASGAWSAAGFDVDGSCCRVGAVTLRLAGADSGGGIVSWGLRDVVSTELDGLPTLAAAIEHEAHSATGHPNGAVAIDHVVAFTPELERTIAAFEAAGIGLRRRRQGEVMGRPVEQAFFRVGEPLLELVAAADVPAGPARFWGLTLTVADLDAAAALLGERLGEPRDAVQPGRRIATVRGAAQLGLPVALITPEPGAAPR
ncbi:MAG: hypothetical protein QOG09_897 [Solirubrobacterales bacterium]|nr:hypothetical protein [Solirubrobacterales bacterium]